MILSTTKTCSMTLSPLSVCTRFPWGRHTRQNNGLSWTHDTLKLSSNSIWLFWSCFAYNTFHVWCGFGACVEVVMWRFERKKTFYIVSLRVKLILACQKGPKMSLVLNGAHKIGCFSFKSDSYLWACTTGGNIFIDIVCRTTNGRSYGTTFCQKGPIELKE
jgi:hypothetical protein